MARAVCALQAKSRWAVTGTPIQNRLSDLSSLLKFIQVHPYTDTKQFDADISRPWKSGDGREAVKRLKHLAACLLLRRPKATIDLPPRRDVVYTVNFTREERIAYDGIKYQAIARLDEVLADEASPAASGAYGNVLQKIQSLRLFSNLGLCYDWKHGKRSRQATEKYEWKSVAQSTFNSQHDMAPITCFQCTATLGLTDTLLDDTTTTSRLALYARCLRYVCSDCVDRASQAEQRLTCGHSPPCEFEFVSTNRAALEEVDSVIAPRLRNAPTNLSSKIETLIEDIKNVSTDTKW